MSFWGFRPYVTVAQRRAKALREADKLRKKGRALKPVVIEGRGIAKAFWGKAWCDNLERYSDFENRLPRGRSYINNGLVIDLQIARGRVEALVSGSELYEVRIDIKVAAPARWRAICADCSGSVGSIVELLQGKLAKHVMQRVCREADGLFPAPKEITMRCSCPDWADMCKHVAATLYGVGARLDRDPDQLFALRGVDRGELVSIDAGASIADAAANSERVLAEDDVAALFGLELEGAKALEPNPPARKAGAAPEAGNGKSASVAPPTSKRPAIKARRGPAADARSRAAATSRAALATKGATTSRSKRPLVAPMKRGQVNPEAAAPSFRKAQTPNPAPALDDPSSLSAKGSGTTPLSVNTKAKVGSSA